MTAKEKQIANCRKLGMSDEEIQAMLADDKEVDRGVIFEWDLSTEEHKKAMKNANVDEKKKKAPMNLNLDATGKKKKANPTKGGIIEEIATFLSENSQFSIENLEIPNKERVISFQIEGNTYEITLSQKRKPKS